MIIFKYDSLKELTMRIISIKKKLISFIFFIPYLSLADCIDINGVEIEKLSDWRLLISKTGQNIAMVSLDKPIKGPLGNIRFFTNELCSSGPSSYYQIRGNLESVFMVSKF